MSDEDLPEEAVALLGLPVHASSAVGNKASLFSMPWIPSKGRVRKSFGLSWGELTTWSGAFLLMVRTSLLRVGVSFANRSAYSICRMALSGISHYQRGGASWVSPGPRMGRPCSPALTQLIGLSRASIWMEILTSSSNERARGSEARVHLRMVDTWPISRELSKITIGSSKASSDS
jgi:hypothetical protein